MGAYSQQKMKERLPEPYKQATGNSDIRVATTY